MCFTPAISLATFLIEIFIAVYLFRKVRNYRIVPIFILFLGFYQLTEFMLCTSTYADFWARAGFVIYTFTPLMIMHSLIAIPGGRFNLWSYLIPSTFSLFAFFTSFAASVSCTTFFVMVTSIVYTNPVIAVMYLGYYMFCPTYGLYYFVKNYKKNSIVVSAAGIPIALSMLVFLIASKVVMWRFLSFILIAIVLGVMYGVYRKKKWVVYSFYILSIVMLIATHLLYPLISSFFPSIFCQLSLFYSFAAILIMKDHFKTKR